MRRSAASWSPAFLLLPSLHTAVIQRGAEAQLQPGLYFGTHFCTQRSTIVLLVLPRAIQAHTKVNTLSLLPDIGPRGLPEAIEILGTKTIEAALGPEYSWP